MAFEAGNVSVSPPQIFAAFHLAAKTLLEGMELEGKPKEDIVKLSVDSSVVSSATVFVAVDEVTQEPIEGAVKVFDLHMSEGTVFDSISHLVQQQQQVHQCVQHVVGIIRKIIACRFEQLRDLIYLSS